MQIAEHLRADNPAKFPFLFIVTYGRSGSTLLQGIVNSVPGYCIRGENYNALYNVFRTYRDLAEAKRKWGRHPTDPTHAWYGIEQVSPNEFAERAVELFYTTCLRPPSDTRCVGFKEIRYTPRQMSDSEFVAYLEFLRSVFPGAGVVFNIRKPEDTASSGFWKHRPAERVLEVLNQTVRRFTSYVDGRDNTFLFSYDELMADWRYAETVFNFLDEEFDANRIKKVLDSRHSFGGGGGVVTCA